ncbi:hypothetical protein Tco_0361042 [Tanacetum coccineum]
MIESCVNQNAVEIQEYFEINDLKARLQDKDTTISKLKDTIKSLKKNTKEKNVNHDKLKCSTSKWGSKPTGNKQNDRISQTPSRNMKNKVEAQPRKVNKKNRVVEPIHNVNVKHSLHAKSAKKTTSHSVETQKPEVKVYSRKPKNVKNVGSSKNAKIVESKYANHSEPNHTWGSNATNIPSSSSLFMTCCLDCSLVSGLRMFETYDREPLSSHELC